MKRPVSRWQMWGFVFTGALGTLLHFFFDWTGGSFWAALIAAVNESIWEHMKLIFLPMVVFSAFQRRYFPEIRGFWWVKLTGILTALVLIPALYYTYTGALGVKADWFNITIFFIAAAAAFRLETALFRRGKACPLPEGLAVVLIGLIGAAFLAFTFSPPEIPLFQDPQNRSFGFQIFSRSNAQGPVGVV